MGNKVKGIVCPDCKSKLELDICYDDIFKHCGVQLRCSNPDCGNVYELSSNQTEPSDKGSKAIKIFIEGLREAVQEAVSIILRDYEMVSEPMSCRNGDSDDVQVLIECEKIAGENNFSRRFIAIENERDELKALVPDKVAVLDKVKKMIHTGYIKEFAINEQIEMCGVMAEAAAAFYFSHIAETKYLESVRLDLYETAMETVINMIKNPTRNNLRMLIETWQEEDIWSVFESAYIDYCVKKYKSSDDKDIIGEYPF